MAVLILVFLLLVIFLIAVNSKGNPDYIALSLVLAVVAPSIISIIMISLLDSGTDGLVAGIYFVFFAALVVIIDGIYLIIKGRKRKENTFVVIGFTAIFMQIIIAVIVLKIASGGFSKIGG